MVDATYMEERPAPPSALKRFVDQRVIPAAIDAAGGMEAGVERLSVQVRARPAATLCSAMLLGLALTYVALRARRPQA